MLVYLLAIIGYTCILQTKHAAMIGLYSFDDLIYGYSGGLQRVPSC